MGLLIHKPGPPWKRRGWLLEQALAALRRKPIARFLAREVQCRERASGVP
jgi:hypothetical protein